MRWRAIGGFFCFFWQASAAACLIEDARFLTETFTSEQEALIRVAIVVGTDSRLKDVEYAGALYQVDEGVKLSLGRGCPGRDEFTLRLIIPGGHELTAFWHTHGSRGPARARFSPTDFRLVRIQQRPFYLITPDGELRVLRPGMRVRQGATVGSIGPPVTAAKPVDVHEQVSTLPMNL